MHTLPLTHLVPGSPAHYRHILERKHGRVQVVYEDGVNVYYLILGV